MGSRRTSTTNANPGPAGPDGTTGLAGLRHQLVALWDQFKLLGTPPVHNQCSHYDVRKRGGRSKAPCLNRLTWENVKMIWGLKPSRKQAQRQALRFFGVLLTGDS